MKYSLASVLSAGAVFSILAMAPSAAEITILSESDDEEVRIILDRESDDGVMTRENYRGHHFTIDEDNAHGHIARMQIESGDVVRTCIRDETNDQEQTHLICTSGNSHTGMRRFDSDDREDLSEAEWAHFEAAMREHEHAMEELEHELTNRDWGMTHLSETVTELAEMAAHIEETVMASLAASGLRMEGDDDGNQTVWIDRDDSDEPSMRVVDRVDGESLVFMYFDGFDNDYHYVIEDGDDSSRDDRTTIHAFDVSTVEIIENDNRGDNLETETSAGGSPHLTVRTDDPDDIRVIELDRSRFDG